MQLAAAIVGTLGPAEELEVQRRIAEGPESHARLGVAGCQRIRYRLLHQDVLHLLDVGAAGQADLEAQQRRQTVFGINENTLQKQPTYKNGDLVVV